MKTLIFVLIFVIGGIFTEAKTVEITPEIRDQNIGRLFENFKRQEKGLNNIAVQIARLNFITEHLSKTEQFKDLMAEAQKGWETYLQELQARADADKDNIIQKQQQEIIALRAKLADEEQEDDKKDK